MSSRSFWCKKTRILYLLIATVQDLGVTEPWFRSEFYMLQTVVTEQKVLVVAMTKNRFFCKNILVDTLRDTIYYRLYHNKRPMILKDNE